ncbi:hypothetical protein [Microbispora amethystogenes]|uniref:DUF3558 domain-containing protein n=1 Tax=Microbispora amethystogenes TaxID=1427754 RepID=A0ABQ4F539_9ACTN|nr:hypothetical protein [Microbispora amethystogenes]GIH29922.1 hypothetical protein Mam01_00860 [Microbispora amethystogenes]
MSRFLPSAARGLLAVLLVVPLAASGCGSPPDVAAPAADTRYTATGTVLQNGKHGPQLCASVQESYPPQCGGADIVGWDWKAVRAESSGGVTWGDYRVVGTWDGSRLTLTEPPREARTSGDGVSGTDMTSPCPEPAGGWRPVDRAKATEEAMRAAMDRAASADEFAGGWLDQHYMDGVDSHDVRTIEKIGNDPTRYVLNLMFTGDLAGRERWIREVWGGALCVSGAERTESDLRAIQRELEGEMESRRFLTLSVDTIGNHVSVGVYVATPELGRELDDRYGKGAVALEGFLKPVGS